MKLLFRYMKPYWKASTLVILFLLTRAMTELSLPRIMSMIVDRGIASGDIPYILQRGLLMLGINIIGMASSFGSSFLSSKVSVKIGTNLRSDLFRKITSFSLTDLELFGASSLITRVTNDINQVQNMALMSLRVMIMAPVMMVGGIFMAVTQDPGLSPTLLTAVPVLFLVITLFGRKGIPLFKVIQEKTDSLNRVVRENLSGLRVIRAFNRRIYEEARFSKANRELTSSTIRVTKLMALLMPVLTLILNSTIILILWLGSVRVDLGTLQVGSLMAFIQYVGQILHSLLMVSMLFIMIPRASVSIKRLSDVLSTEPAVQDNVKPSPLPSDFHLEFDRVSFRYHGAEEPALEEISFGCAPGEVTAIIGSTGSGKSSLLNLILRFHDPETGSIKLGGTDIRDLSQSDLRSVIGYVPQKAFLFSGSVKDNLLYGNPAADGEELAGAMDVAQASDFVSALTNGVETDLSKGGTTVSGGQRQRLALARALVRKPKIYLFDDTFSALDANTELALRKALKTYTKEALVLIVTQRITSARGADKIIVLDNGRVTGVGTHAELAASNQVYREILNSQLGEGLSNG